jgi:hypothetical protein
MLIRHLCSHLGFGGVCTYVLILALEVFGVGALRRENRDFWICSLQLEATLSNKREKTSVKEIEMSELMN